MAAVSSGASDDPRLNVETLGAMVGRQTPILAVIVPLVLVTVIRARAGRLEAHRGIARWTLPLWLYVSVTGVVVYWMLYRMNWVA